MQKERVEIMVQFPDGIDVGEIKSQVMVPGQETAMYVVQFEMLGRMLGSDLSPGGVKPPRF